MTDKPAKTADWRLRTLVAALVLFLIELAMSSYVLVAKNDWAAIGAPNILIPLIGCITIVFSIFRMRSQPTTNGEACSSYFKCLPQPAIVVNSQGRIKHINPAAARIVNQSPESLIDQPVHGLFHPQHHPDTECQLCQVIVTGGELQATDFHFPNRQWQQISLSKLNDEGELIQLHCDVTSRKRTEEQMALVIDGAELGFWDWDYVTGQHQVNQRWLDMLGLGPDELDNYVSDWDRRIHPDDHDRVHKLITSHIDSGESYVVEFRMRHKLGHWVWIQGSGAVVAYDPVTHQPSRLCGIHQNISSRKQSESNLAMAYQIISQSLSVVFKWQGSDGLPIEFATENAHQLLGHGMDSLLSGHARYLAFVHPDDRDTFQLEIANCFEDKDCNEILHLPYRLISDSGVSKWVQDRKVVIRDEQGNATGYQGLVTDITRQRQQNNAIRNIISTTLENNATSPLDNLTLLASETLGAQYALIGEINQSDIAKTLSFFVKGQIVPNIEYDIRNTPCAVVANGTICNYRENVSEHFPADTWLVEHGIQGYLGIPLQDDQHRIFGFVVTLYCQPIPDPQFAEDILKLFALQITAELERLRAIDALRTQKQRLLDAQSISHIGDWHWHWSDNHFSWSDEMYRITGTNRANFMPNLASILAQLVHPDDQSFFKTGMQNASHSGVIDFKHRIVMLNGEIRHVHQRGKTIHDQNKKITGIQGTMQDITDRLKSEQRLKEAKHQAEKATRVKSEFLANMSHEIRTPLNAIVGLVELCLNSDIGSKQRDYLERVETAAHSLMTIIEDILDFSKMEAGKLRLDTSPFLLEDMLDQVFSTMNELANAKGIKLIRPDAGHGYHAVIGDSQRLKQVLINLIGNAIKFTDQGEVNIVLEELNRTSEHTCLQFSIIDTGIGMNAHKQAKLFQAFSQGDSSVTRNYGGTGLGLVISKQLIEQMGGNISVASREGFGSTFKFTVTLGVTSISSIRDTLARQRKDIDTNQLQYIRDARVLLVEDNEVNRIVAIELLQKAQLSVDTAENGEIALNKLQHNHYDCVLMDVQMPVLDGYQTTRKLRQINELKHLPVIAMTANVMSGDRNKCLQAGMDDFIGKPILPETLYATLLKWIKPVDLKTCKPDARDLANAQLPFLYGIDTVVGLQHTADNAEVYRKILKKFVENHSQSMAEIKTAFNDENYDRAYQLVHTVKGLAGSLGALQLQGQLNRLEEALYSPSPDDTISGLIDVAERELNKISNSIQSTLSELPLAETFDKTIPLPEIHQHLTVLLSKLTAFDSDADQLIEKIMATRDETLQEALTPIKKQIANYQFVDAAHALSQLLTNLIAK